MRWTDPRMAWYIYGCGAGTLGTLAAIKAVDGGQSTWALPIIGGLCIVAAALIGLRNAWRET